MTTNCTRNNTIHSQYNIKINCNAYNVCQLEAICRSTTNLLEKRMWWTLSHACRQMFLVYLSRGSTFLFGAMLAFLKIQCRMETPTLLIDAYLLKEQCCQISSQSNLKRRNLGFFEEDGYNKNRKKKHMSNNSS